MLMSLHTIISNQVVSTPRLSGGGQALQSLSMTMTISLMQTMESWGRPGSAPHTHTHTDCLLLYKPPLFCYEYITKTVSGDQIKFCCIILSFLYKRSPDRQLLLHFYSAWSRLKLITKMGFKHHHPHTKNFFNPSKKKIWVNKSS